MSRVRENRVLLIADTHGRIHPQILALADTVGTIVHAGDVGHPEILVQLGRNTRPVHAVRGNNDTPGKWPAGTSAALTALPSHLELVLPGGTLAVEHGDKVNPVAQRHERLRQRHPHARLILYGHSHRQLIDDERDPWVVNPGAAGRSRTFGGSACVLLTTTNDHWRLSPQRFPLADWKE